MNVADNAHLRRTSRSPCRQVTDPLVHNEQFSRGVARVTALLQVGEHGGVVSEQVLLDDVPGDVRFAPICTIGFVASSPILLAREAIVQDVILRSA